MNLKKIKRSALYDYGENLNQFLMSTYHLLKILLFFKIILHKSLLQLLKNSFSSFGKNIEVDFADLNVKK